jgi:prepilin-type N-terminal cleavage/methylation domain-containing protein
VIRRRKAKGSLLEIASRHMRKWLFFNQLEVLKMTKNKKGFTLTEIIVVIAMIAILSAVLIPSFGRYVTYSRISKDEMDVAEINNVISLMKQSNEEFASPQSLEEARTLINEITTNRFSYQARVKGYHFWYNIQTDKMYVSTLEEMIDYQSSYRLDLVDQTKLLNQTTRTPIELLPEGFIYTNERPVIFLELRGSDLANIVHGFKQVDNFTQYQSLHNQIEQANLESSIQNHFLSLFNQTLFITNEGNFLQSNQQAQNTIFSNDALIISNTLTNLEGQTETISNEKQVLNLSYDLVIPNQIQAIMSNAINSQHLNHKVIFNQTIDQVLSIVEPSFTNMPFVTIDGEHQLDNHIVLNQNNEATHALNYQVQFDVHTFDLLLNGVVSSEAHYAFVGEEISLSAINFKNINGNQVVRSKEVSYSINNFNVASLIEGQTLVLENKGQLTLTAQANGASQSIEIYIIDEQDELPYTTLNLSQTNTNLHLKTGNWSTNDYGLRGTHGIIWFENAYESYTLTLNATLDEMNTSETGGYGIVFNASLNGLEDTSLALQFDRGFADVIIRPRINGREQAPILKVSDTNRELVPASKRDAYWTEQHEIKMMISLVDGQANKRSLTVEIDGQMVIDSFIFEANQESNQYFGLRAWTVPTVFHQVKIENHDQDSTEVINHKNMFSLMTQIVEDALLDNIFDGVRLNYFNSAANQHAWSTALENFLVINDQSDAYQNRYQIENQLQASRENKAFNGQYILNWQNMNRSALHDNPAVFITNNSNYSYDQFDQNHQDFSLLLGTMIFYKTDDRSNEIFYYAIDLNGIKTELGSFLI